MLLGRVSRRRHGNNNKIMVVVVVTTAFALAPYLQELSAMNCWSRLSLEPCPNILVAHYSSAVHQGREPLTFPHALDPVILHMEGYQA